MVLELIAGGGGVGKAQNTTTLMDGFKEEMSSVFEINRIDRTIKFVYLKYLTQPY